MKKIFVILAFIAIFSGMPGVTSAATIGKPMNNVDLMGWWTFDGSATDWSANTVQDLSGHYATGTLATLDKSTAAVAGKLGQALYMDGGTMTVASTTALNQNDIVTIAFWIKGTPSTVAYKQLIWHTTDTNTAGWQVVQDNLANGIALRLDTSAGSLQVSTPVTALDGLWHHFVYVINTGKMNTFKDGQFVVSDTYSHGNGFAGYFPIYLNLNSGSLFPAAIDDLRIYGTALATSSITQLYGLGTAKTNASSQTLSNGSTLKDGLMGHWTFDGAVTDWTANTTQDLSGHYATGTFSTLNKSTAAVIGKMGQALYVNNGGMAVASTTALNQSSATTIAFWVKGTPSATAYKQLLRHTSDVPIGWQIQQDGVTSAIYLRIDTSGGTQQNSGDTTALDGSWHHIVYVVNSGKVNIFNNGQSVSNSSYTPGNGFNGFHLLYLNNTGAKDLPASFDDLRIYDRVLATSTITQLYNLGGNKINASSQTLTNGSTLKSGLVEHLTFDGPDMTNTSIADKSGQGSNAYLYNAATSSAKAIGKLGQGLRLDGVSSYVKFAGPTTANYTIAFWVYPTNCDSQADTQLFDTASDLVGISCSMGPGTGYVINWGGVGGYAQAPAGAIVNNKWQHIVVTSESNVNKIYVNNVLSAAGAAAGGITGAMYLGKVDGGSRYFAGTMDDFRIYNYALSTSTLTQLYNIGR